MKALIDFTPAAARLLDAPGVVEHLIVTGALSAEQVVRNGVVVNDRSSRCRTFLVRAGESGFVLKQGTNSETVQSVDNEASTYAQLSALGRTVPMPRMISFEGRCLVTELVRGGTLAELILQDRTVHAARAAEVATMLATLHRTEVEVDPDEVPLARPSPVFLLVNPPLVAFQFHSHGSHQLTRLVQSDEVLAAGLSLLYSQWQPSHMIHNDVRPDNIVVTPSSDLVLIDWELAGLGDPRWDLAGLMAEHLVAFLEDADIWTLSEGERAPASADRLDQLRRTCWQILEAYRVGTAVSVHPAELIPWMAGRMVLTTMERCSTASAVSAVCRHLLQVAANLFRRPEAGARIFLGVEQS